MPYILKNNKIDKRYEEKFFEIVRENLPVEKIELFNGLLDIKTEIIKEFLSGIIQTGGKLENEKLDKILSMFFSIRRHKEKILNGVSGEALKNSFAILADSKKSAEIRIGRFLELFSYDDVIVKRDIALELLHFYEPDKNVFWTSWVYRQDNGTGCLPYMADFLKRTPTDKDLDSA